MDDIHLLYQLSKFLFVKHAFVLLVDLFKDICKVLQEFFMLFKLEVKDNFLEVCVKKFALILRAHHLHNLFTAHFP